MGMIRARVSRAALSVSKIAGQARQIGVRKDALSYFASAAGKASPRRGHAHARHVGNLAHVVAVDVVKQEGERAVGVEPAQVSTHALERIAHHEVARRGSAGLDWDDAKPSLELTSLDVLVHDPRADDADPSVQRSRFAEICDSSEKLDERKLSQVFGLGVALAEQTIHRLSDDALSSTVKGGGRARLSGFNRR